MNGNYKIYKTRTKALHKGSILLCASMPPPWDTETMDGVRVPTYSNRVVIFFLFLPFSPVASLKAFIIFCLEGSGERDQTLYHND